MRSAISRMRRGSRPQSTSASSPLMASLSPASAAIPDAGGFAEAGEASVGVDQDDGVFRGLVRAEAALERLWSRHAHGDGFDVGDFHGIS